MCRHSAAIIQVTKRFSDPNFGTKFVFFIEVLTSPLSFSAYTSAKLLNGVFFFKKVFYTKVSVKDHINLFLNLLSYCLINHALIRHSILHVHEGVPNPLQKSTEQLKLTDSALPSFLSFFFFPFFLQSTGTLPFGTRSETSQH